MGGEAGHGISKKLYVYTVSGNLAGLSTRIGTMADLSCGRHEKLRDIAMLPITELRSVKYAT